MYIVVITFSKTSAELLRLITGSPRLIGNLFQNHLNLQKKFFLSKIMEIQSRLKCQMQPELDCQFFLWFIFACFLVLVQLGFLWFLMGICGFYQ